MLTRPSAAASLRNFCRRNSTAENNRKLIPRGTRSARGIRRVIYRALSAARGRDLISACWKGIFERRDIVEISPGRRNDRPFIFITRIFRCLPLLTRPRGYGILRRADVNGSPVADREWLLLLVLE